MPASQVRAYAGMYGEMLENNPYDAELSSSGAMCYLKLKLYDDKALSTFEMAIERDFACLFWYLRGIGSRCWNRDFNFRSIDMCGRNCRGMG